MALFCTSTPFTPMNARKGKRADKANGWLPFVAWRAQVATIAECSISLFCEVNSLGHLRMPGLFFCVLSRVEGRDLTKRLPYATLCFR